MRSLWRWMVDLKWSFAGMALAMLFAFLSLGLQGLVLYWLASPVLNLFFPPLETWDPSGVWPLIVAAGFLWSPSFVAAGALTSWLRGRGLRRALRVLAYLFVLWVGSVLAWLVLLLTNRVL